MKKIKMLMVAGTVAATTFVASAQSDITGVVDSLDGYLTAAVAIGVAILLFTLGRAIVRKIAR